MGDAKLGGVNILEKMITLNVQIVVMSTGSCISSVTVVARIVQ